jgi:HdeA/HdeB family
VRVMTKQTKALRYAAVATAFLIASAYGPASAQLILEMSALKCKDYTGAPPDRQELIAAWMSGYFNAARNMPTVDFSRFATNKKLVEKYCRRHKADNLMNAIKKVTF